MQILGSPTHSHLKNRQPGGGFHVYSNLLAALLGQAGLSSFGSLWCVPVNANLQSMQTTWNAVPKDSVQSADRVLVLSTINPTSLEASVGAVGFHWP